MLLATLVLIIIIVPRDGIPHIFQRFHLSMQQPKQSIFLILGFCLILNTIGSLIEVASVQIIITDKRTVA